MNKISPETKSLASDPSGKDKPVPVTPIPPIQNNPPTHSSSPSLSYKSISPSHTLESKKPTLEIQEDDNVNSNAEMQSFSPQQPLQPVLQTPQKDHE